MARRGALHEQGGVGGSSRWHHLIEHIQDAVVEFELQDGAPVVRGVNQSFVEVFGYDRAVVQGESLNDYIVPRWLADEASALDERTAEGEVNYRRVKRETTNGLREFLYRGIPYDIDGTRTDGFAVYTDLTELRCYEQQFDVLNRLLRHDLRNQTNVLLGNADVLLSELADSDAETDAMAEAATHIQTAAERLRSLGEEATRIRKVLRSTVPSEATVDCVPLIRRLLADHRRTDAAAVETDLPDRMVVRATSDLMDGLDPLVDNAIRHNPAATPRLRIRVVPAGDPDWVDIHVDDDGPRIPASEQAIIRDDVELTPLRHGTGLGLWLARLTTESFGGTLSVGTNEWGGNRLTLRLQRV